jgi:4-hydroxybenzoate polyprenyltransferase
MSNLRAWAQMVRVPNTLTSCADVLAGMCIAGGISNHFMKHPGAAIVASAASICFYWAGMVLNDVFDVEQDREQGRPNPIANGKITITVALRSGIGLMVVGILLSFLAPLTIALGGSKDFGLAMLSPGLVGCLLAVAVYAYDGPLKKSPSAPLIMGICRGLNMSLGVAWIAAVLPVTLGWPAVAVVAGHVAYVTGLTIAARREADLSQSRGRLTLGWGICAFGAACIAFSPRLEMDRPYRLDPEWVFPLLVAILLLPLARRAVDAIRTLRPQQLGMAIRQAIFSILFLDATSALQYSEDIPGIIIASMVVPTLLLARWFRAT